MSESSELRPSPIETRVAEREPTPDTVLERRLAAIGVALPQDEHPRGIRLDHPGFHAVNLLGTPLYAYSNEIFAPDKRDTMRMHEMTHGFVQANLVPDQPRVDVDWDKVTDEDVEALIKGHYSSGTYASQLAEEAKTKLYGVSLSMYRDDPVRALANLRDSIEEDAISAQRVNAAAIARGRPPRLPFEAVSTSVVQRITGQLREQVYHPFGLHRTVDFEEGLATYFAYKADPSNPDPETWSFDQGEKAKGYTLALAREYPDPKQVSGKIQEDGMQGFLIAHRSMIEAA